MRPLLPLAVLLALAAPARAEVVAEATSPTRLDLDAGTVFYDAGPDLWSAGIGRAPQRLTRLYEVPGCAMGAYAACPGAELQWGASSQAVASRYQRTVSVKGSTEPSGTSLAFGPPAGPLGQIEACAGDPRAPGVIVDGAALAYRTACGAPYRIVVREGEDVWEFEAPGFDANPVALAGPWLAVMRSQGEARVVDVHDRRTRTLAYTAGALPDDPGAQFGLAADGRLVAAHLVAPETPCVAGLSWWSAAEPVPHPMPGCLFAQALRVSGERVAFLTSDGGEDASIAVARSAAARSPR